ncbi:flagellar motor switch protein [Serpentinimonas maccroryi]|jgi:hypothetical protein|uniref:Flagellar motor switch protein n=1 Tax=Serpentinimonas maccroryi TaxID=1458426 RepID=A0A060NUW7_9BURK|nr:addiction module protein [Serpentinimonas maccroryi]BAO82704.1 flagellar motor switch protein [Serpentinimonas maccroryi]
MEPTFEALEAQVLQLSDAQRARLLDRVLASLDVDPASVAVWDAVAQARERSAAQDPSLMLPLDSVLERLRAQLT